MTLLPSMVRRRHQGNALRTWGVSLGRLWCFDNDVGRGIRKTLLMAMTMGLAISMISKRARRATTILGTLTMGFSKAKTRQRLHLLSPQINLLYLPLHQVL